MTASTESLPEVFLARHGETEWSVSGQHTGRTDIPLTERGEQNARRLGERLAGMTFARVFVSPMQRALRTSALAGFGDRGEVEPDLREWDYGRYEGMRTVDIRKERPDWLLFRDGCPEGESVDEIGARADRLVARLRPIEGRLLLFGHAHIFRVLTARWLGLPPGDARHFVLGTASLSVLGYEHNRDEPAIRLWNDVGHMTG
jgi:probable phosphoglycerate mutase